MDPSHFQQACTGGFILNGKNEVLLVKRADDDDDFPGFWELPGGGMDYGEDPQASLKREIQEECGIDAEVLYPLVVNTYTMPIGDTETQRLEITFLCKRKNPQQEVKLSHEHSAYQWVARDNLKDFELSDYMRQVIADALNNPICQNI